MKHAGSRRRTQAQRKAVMLFSAAGGAGAAGVALLAVLFSGVGEADEARNPAAARAELPAPQPKVQASASSPVATSSATPSAMSFYKMKAPGTAKLIEDVKWSGNYLRVYTSESGEESKPALSICELTAKFLEEQGKEPVVFVHAKATGQVLANKSSSKDSCKLEVVP